MPMQHSSSQKPAPLPGSDPTQHGEEPTTSQAPPDLHRTSAARLARLNTVSRHASPSRPQAQDAAAADPLNNGQIPDDHADHSHRRTDSQSASASSALSQLLHSDTQASTGTPMARDLTEALTALASNKRLMSSMQASRSFSSPDLLSLAQQLQDSGQWPAVQDMVQREEDEWADGHPEAQSQSAHSSYGTVVGRPHMGSVNDEGQTPTVCSCLSSKQASNTFGCSRCFCQCTCCSVPPKLHVSLSQQPVLGCLKPCILACLSNCAAYRCASVIVFPM